MPEIKFIVTQARANEAIAAFNRFWGRNDVTVADIKQFMGAPVNEIIKSYRKAVRDAANPIDDNDLLEV